jgi:hypothetical protein
MVYATGWRDEPFGRLKAVSKVERLLLAWPLPFNTQKLRGHAEAWPSKQQCHWLEGRAFRLAQGREQSRTVPVRPVVLRNGQTWVPPPNIRWFGGVLFHPQASLGCGTRRPRRSVALQKNGIERQIPGGTACLQAVFMFQEGEPVSSSARCPCGGPPSRRLART